MAIHSGGGSGTSKTFFSIYSSELVLEYQERESLEKRLESLGFSSEPHGHHKGIQIRQRQKGKHVGQDVFYYVINDVEGMLTDITIKEQEWGDVLELEITDVDEKFIVSLGEVSSKIVKDFIRRVNNIDLKKEVKFGLWNMTEEETSAKARSGVKMYQDKIKVEYVLTYDIMPPPVQKQVGRKQEWDYSEQATYLYNYLVKYIAENFRPDLAEPVPEPPKQVAPKKVPVKTATKKPAKPVKVHPNPKDEIPF